MSDQKDLNTILHEITGELTGDPDRDIPYLKSQIEKYKNHELGKEIVRACGRLMFDLIPEDRKEALAQVIRNERSAINATLEEVRFNIFKKDFAKALTIIEALAEKIESSNAFEDDQASAYFVFDEFFEQMIYAFRYKPEKTIRPAQVPYTEIYMLYGSLLFEMKRYDEARIILKKGLRWNPVSFRLMTEYAETFKAAGDLEQYYSLVLDTFKIAFRPKDVGRCFRNLGYYFIEKQLYSEAMSAYLLSLQFDPDSAMAKSEMYYISTKTKKGFRRPTADQIKEYARQYGFPLGADRDILGIAVTNGKLCLSRNNVEAARYFLTIFYDLTKDEEVRRMIDGLPTGPQA